MHEILEIFFLRECMKFLGSAYMMYV